MTRRVWLSERETAAIHSEQIVEHGGNPGTRTPDSLARTITRLVQRHTHARLSLFHLSAAYALGIARGRPFAGGNLTTALVVSFTFLELNGWRVVAEEEDAAVQFRQLASGAMNENLFAAWLRHNCVRLSVGR